MTLTEKVAAVFKAEPYQWIDGRRFAEVGGYGGWRTRVSDCRQQLGMTIVNRTRREGRFTISEYMYRPADQPGFAWDQEHTA